MAAQGCGRKMNEELMRRCRVRARQMMQEQTGISGYEVWQHLGQDRGYRHVGFLPGLPVRSTSGIFQIRPTDFRMGEVDGKQVIIAAWNIGPGDFACVPGFIKADGSRPERSEAADLYDAIAGGQLEKIEGTIKRMLGEP